MPSWGITNPYAWEETGSDECIGEVPDPEVPVTKSELDEAYKIMMGSVVSRGAGYPPSPYRVYECHYDAGGGKICGFRCSTERAFLNHGVIEHIRAEKTEKDGLKRYLEVFN